MQTAMRHLYLGSLSRNSGSKVEIAVSGDAMAAKTSTCHNCGKPEYYARNCYKDKSGIINKSSEVYDKQYNNNA